MGGDRFKCGGKYWNGCGTWYGKYEIKGEKLLISNKLSSCFTVKTKTICSINDVEKETGVR